MVATIPQQYNLPNVEANLHFNSVSLDRVLLYISKTTKLTIVPNPKMRTLVTIHGKADTEQMYEILSSLLDTMNAEIVRKDNHVAIDYKKNAPVLQPSEPLEIKSYTIGESGQNLSQTLNYLTAPYKTVQYEKWLFVNAPKDLHRQIEKILPALKPFHTKEARIYKTTYLEQTQSEILSAIVRNTNPNFSLQYYRGDLIVVCDEATHKSLETILDSLDVPVEQRTNTFLFNLKNLNAEDAARILQNLSSR